MNSSEQALHGFSDIFIVNSSLPFLTAKFASSLGTVSLLLLASAVHWYLNRPRKLSLPVARSAKDGNDLTDSLEEAKRMYPDQAFIMPFNPPQVILPNSLLNEIRNMPDDQMSFRKATYALLLGEYTSIGVPRPQLVEAIKVDLTRNIAKTLSDLQDEVIFAVQKEFGSCDDWTGVGVYQSLLNTVARISARVFVGLPLCRDNDWIKITTHYTEDVVAGFKAISKYPFFIRPIVSPFIPELRALKVARRRAGKMIAPTVLTIMNSSESGSKALSDDVWDADTSSHYGDDQYNLISWILRHYKSHQQPNAEVIGEEQLLTGFAAIHTTSATASHAIYDLASYPQYIPELRAEIAEVSAEEPDGKLRKTSMPKLRKLDSFIKESQRMHPLGMVSMLRLITAKKGVTLSSGLHLPHGTYVAVAHPQMTASVSYRETPELPQPSFDEFHPFRYSDLRSYEGGENKHQFVTTSPESVSFGHGQWACPGRFFASNEIKVILIELLRNYDIGLGPNGEGQGGEFQRPKTYTVDTSYIPDPTAKIFFRRRQ